MVANIAFMGNAVVEGIFGNDILFDYLMFTLPINLFLNNIGASMALISNLPALITIPLIFFVLLQDQPFYRFLQYTINTVCSHFTCFY